MTPIGRRAVAMSVTMLIAALVYLHSCQLHETCSRIRGWHNSPNLQARKTTRVIEEVLSCPECVNRNAHDQCAEDRPESPQDNHHDHTIAKPSEVDLREDPEILQHDGKLCQPQCGIVCPNRCPEPSRNESLVLGRKLPGMLAHAIFGLLVGGDAEDDREDSRDENQSIVETGLLSDECASAYTRYDSQAGEDGEDDRDDVEGELRGVTRDGGSLGGDFFNVHFRHWCIRSPLLFTT